MHSQDDLLKLKLRTYMVVGVFQRLLIYWDFSA